MSSSEANKLRVSRNPVVGSSDITGINIYDRINGEGGDWEFVIVRITLIIIDRGIRLGDGIIDGGSTDRVDDGIFTIVDGGNDRFSDGGERFGDGMIIIIIDGG